MNNEQKYDLNKFDDFYAYYLEEHKQPMTKLFHFIGTSVSLIFILLSIYKREGHFLVYALFVGYGFAWFSHLVFEKNRPATFRYPFRSFLSDWKMWFELLSRKRSFK